MQPFEGVAAKARQPPAANGSAMPYLIGPARLARYFFHECERYLRYQSTPKKQWSLEGIPPKESEHSPVTRSLLDLGTFVISR